MTSLFARVALVFIVAGCGLSSGEVSGSGSAAGAPREPSAFASLERSPRVDDAENSVAGNANVVVVAEDSTRAEAPDDVQLRRQFNIFEGGGPGSCDEEGTEHPAVNKENTSSEVEVGGIASLAFCGFGQDGPVRMAVVQPDGMRHESVLAVDAVTESPTIVAWYALPAAPTGQYEVAVTDGNASVTATFEVVQASDVKVVALRSSVQSGDEPRFMLAGFPPNEVVNLDLYELRPNTNFIGLYHSSYTVRVSSDGGAVAALPPDRLRTPGHYVLKLRGRGGDQSEYEQGSFFVVDGDVEYCSPPIVTRRC